LGYNFDYIKQQDYNINMKSKKTIFKKVLQYPVIVQEDESKGYWVNCPVLEGCYSQGETIDEALKNIREAISLCLENISENKLIEKTKRQISLHFVKA
jgi:predicted RNase H-like HicB family nuclease